MSYEGKGEAVVFDLQAERCSTTERTDSGLCPIESFITNVQTYEALFCCDFDGSARSRKQDSSQSLLVFAFAQP